MVFGVSGLAGLGLGALALGPGGDALAQQVGAALVQVQVQQGGDALAKQTVPDSDCAVVVPPSVPPVLVATKDQCDYSSWADALGGSEKPLPSGTYLVSSQSCGKKRDGSWERPFCTIRQAVARTKRKAGPEGRRILVDPGTYTTRIKLGKEKGPLEIRGLCRKTTILEAPGKRPLFKLGKRAKAQLTLGDLTLRGEGDDLVQVHSGFFGGQRLRFETQLNTGLRLYGTETRASLEDAFFEATPVAVGSPSQNLHGLVSTPLPEPLANPDGFGGPCLLVLGGAQVWVQNLNCHFASGVGVVVDGTGSFLDVDVGVIADTLPGVPSFSVPLGIGMAVENGGFAAVRQLWLERNTTAGVFAHGAATQLVFNEGAIDNTFFTPPVGTTPSSYFGYGLAVANGASATVCDARIRDNRSAGIVADGAGSKLNVKGGSIEDTALHVDNLAGYGVALQAGAEASLSGVLIEGNHTAGVLATGAASRVEIGECEIRETVDNPLNGAGRGLSLQSGAHAKVRYTEFTDNNEVGIFASDSGSSLELSDSVVSGTIESLATGSGIGVLVQDHAVATLQSVDLDANEAVGLNVTNHATVSVEASVLAANNFAGVVLVDAGLSLKHTQILSTQVHSSRGGAVGLFAHNTDDPSGFPLNLVAEDNYFSDHLGPSVYVRGESLPGTSVEFTSNEFIDPVGPSSMVPGNLVFLNVPPPSNASSPAAIVLNDNAFWSQANIEVRLHATWAELAGNDYSGAGLAEQFCYAAPYDEVDSSAETNFQHFPCGSPVVEVEPVLYWSFDFVELEAVE